MILAGILCLAFACTPSSGPTLADDDLIIVDLDAGIAHANGERAGKIFLARAADGYAHPIELTHDETWPEPVDAIILPDRSLLVLDSRITRGSSAARGAIFHCKPPTWEPAEWWSDERARQPVSMARGRDGTIYVADREADPLGLGEETGCLFAIRVEPGAGGPGLIQRTDLLAAGRELVTPAAILVAPDDTLLLLDADVNPHDVTRPDGMAGSPGALYRLKDRRDGKRAELEMLLAPRETVSPIALIARGSTEIFLVDANGNLQDGFLGDGVIWRLGPSAKLRRVVDTAALGTPRALVDPVHGDVLPDGRLVIADANADPLGLGEDGTGKGVYGTGRGALLAVDPDVPSVTTLIADERFVAPIAVRRVRP